MLASQKRRPEFTGGLEAKRLNAWHCEWLVRLKPASMWFAYDGPEDQEPLHSAAALLRAHGLITPSRRVRCYVLVGHKRDTMDAAEARLRESAGLGFLPMAMLYRDGVKTPTKEWRKFQRAWARPSSIMANIGPLT